MYLSTILDDDSRYIIAWKLCTSMKAEDVSETLELALKASGCDQAKAPAPLVTVSQTQATSDVGN